MAGLQIPPHSNRLSSVAVLGLTLLSAVSFAAGIERQLATGGPSPFPATQGSAAQGQAAGAIPEATPAPDMQVVADARPHHRAAAETAADAAPVVDTPDSSQALPATDVADVVPDTPPAPPPSTPPDTDPPT